MRRNAGLLLAARLASAMTTLVCLALIGRLRGPDALGAVGIGFAAGAIAATISDLGTATLLVREVARRPLDADAMMGAGLVLRVITVPLVLAGAWLAGIWIAPTAAGVVLLVAAGLVGQQAAEMTRSVFIANQRMAVSSAHAIVENVAWLGVVVVGLAAGLSLEQVFLLALAVWLGSLIVGLALVGRLLGRHPRWPGVSRTREIVRQAGPFGAFAIVGIAYARIDPLLIGLLASGPALVAAGVYFGATRLLAAFEYLPEAVSRAAFPELARRAADVEASIEPVLRSAAVALLAIGLLVPVLLLAAGGWLMVVVYGPGAGQAGWVLGALSIIMPVRYLAYLYGVTLTSADAQGRRVVAAAGALVVVLLIDVLGLPRVGLVAPVASTILAGLFVLGTYATFVNRRFGTTGLSGVSAVALVVGAALGAAAALAASSLVPVPIAACIGAGVYLAAAWLGPARADVQALIVGR